MPHLEDCRNHSPLRDLYIGIYSDRSKMYSSILYAKAIPVTTDYDCWSEARQHENLSTIIPHREGRRNLSPLLDGSQMDTKMGAWVFSISLSMTLLIGLPVIGSIFQGELRSVWELIS